MESTRVFRTIPKDRWNELDGLKTEGLRTVLQYSDAQTDDAALTRAVMQSAESLGADLLCPGRFVSGRVLADHCEVSIDYDNQQHRIRADVVVNAAGPWARNLLSQFDPPLPDFPVDNVQGTHIELPAPVRKGCYYLEVPSDKRAIFVMPWRDHTLLGTTEYIYNGNPADADATVNEVDYLISAYKQFFPENDIEVLSSWAGLRVLPAKGDAFKRSRETMLPVDNESKPRVVSIFGGKLTGYRATALKVLKRVAKSMSKADRIADTSDLELA